LKLARAVSKGMVNIFSTDFEKASLNKKGIKDHTLIPLFGLI
jgi:hypothetical protein